MATDKERTPQSVAPREEARHFRLTTRSVFVLALFAVAAVPVILRLLWHASPTTAVDVATTSLRIGSEATKWAAIAAAVLLIAWPPFLPAIRVGFRRLRRRLSTDPGPLLEAQARLQHFETAADHRLVGRVLRAQHDYAAALSHLDRAHQLDPADLATRYEIGRVLLGVGRAAPAAQFLGSVVAADPDHDYGAAMLHFGLALERGGDDVGAERAYREVLARAGESRRALCLLGRTLLRLRRPDEAAELLRRAAAPATRRLDPEEALWRARARVLCWTLRLRGRNS